MSNDAQTVTSLPRKKKSIFPTLLDYAVLILLAVASAAGALYYLTLENTQKVTQPSAKLEGIFKP